MDPDPHHCLGVKISYSVFFITDVNIFHVGMHERNGRIRSGGKTKKSTPTILSIRRARRTATSPQVERKNTPPNPAPKRRKRLTRRPSLAGAGMLEEHLAAAAAGLR